MFVPTVLRWLLLLRPLLSLCESKEDSSVLGVSNCSSSCGDLFVLHNSRLCCSSGIYLDIPYNAISIDLGGIFVLCFSPLVVKTGGG